MSASRRRRQAGYTLVELIIAMAIGAMVLGALTSIVVTTALSTNLATSRVDASNQVRNFQLTAYDDLALSNLPTIQSLHLTTDGAPGSSSTEPGLAHASCVVHRDVHLGCRPADRHASGRGR